MTTRTFLIGSFLNLLIGWGIWLLIINWIDPAKAGLIGLVLFFLALFLAITSTAGIIGYGVRRLLVPGQLSAYRVRPSLRQGIWLGLLLDILLFLQLQRLLRWWVALILIILFISIEFFYLSYDKGTNRHKTAEQAS